MPLIDLTDENFDQEIENHSLAVLDFWAPWCAPCKAFAPTFEAASERYPKILFARINLDEQPLLGQQFEVRSVPTLLFAKDGTITKVHLGSLPPAQFEDVLKSLEK